MKLIFFLFFMISSSWACSPDGKEGFLPPNDLHLQPIKSFNSITKEESQKIIDRVYAVYAPLFREFSAELVIENQWMSETVNAAAKRDGKNWKIIMHGGLARHRTITSDALTLVLCHEMAHHIGGAPRKTKTTTWLVTEGQSDYFAALKCVRRLWSDDPNFEIISKMNSPKALRDECKKNWSDPNEYALCVRTGLAGESLGRLLASLNRRVMVPHFNRPDKTEVKITLEGHPSAQCRLDTFFQGALCSVDYLEEVSQEKESEGTCHKKLGHSVGLRPRCWYAQKEEGQVFK